jgi:general secretion pathway protein F
MMYEVKAYRASEGVVMLRFEVSDAGDAKRKAEAQGYRVISFRSQRALFGHARRQHFPLPLFSQELLALLDAGLMLLEAIETLAEKERHPEVSRVLDELIRMLREGQHLSQAMQSFPAVFPPLYVATIRASERTGDMQEALRRYLSYQAQIDAVRKKIVNASIYPTLLFVVGGLVTLFLMAYVVPRFSHIYEDMGDNIPLMSRLLMEWGKLFEAHGELVVLGFVLLIAGSGYWLVRPETRVWLMRKLWQFPAIGERMRVYQLARFYRTTGMLLRGGIPLVTALDMVGDLLGYGLRDNLQRANHQIREGRSVHESLCSHGLTTEVSLRMLLVGERSGSLGEMMERIAGFYDEDMARWVEWFSRLFEPLLMVVIGLIIGLIVLLMYMPIFELAGSIQ